jgi:hypothetical protein
MIRLEGKIVDADANWLTVRVPYHHDYVSKDMEKAIVFLPDGRKRSPQQNDMAWALIGAIMSHAGYRSSEKEYVNNALKRKFLHDCFDELTKDAIIKFSMSDVDVSTASKYISFLVDLIMEENIPTKRPITEMCEDIQQAVYSAMMHKRCIVCGKKADLHHVDRVGMGGDRHDMCHIGMRALPLCREHHNEAHQHGDAALMDKYHLETVIIDDRIAKKYRL